MTAVTSSPAPIGLAANGATGHGHVFGFACVWDRPDPARTWSYTPWHLRETMRRHVDVVDVGVDLPPQVQRALKVIHARQRGGRLVTTWRFSRLTDALIQQVVGRAARAADCDAVLEIHDLAILDRPFFVYQDLSFGLLQQLIEAGEVALPLGLTANDVRQRHARQCRVYERAAGVLAMSHWFARQLVEESGLPQEKVHVVQPGRSAVRADGKPIAVSARERPRRRLLTVGTDFLRKGGELTVAALAVLRREVDPAITLTVAGPPTWPLAGPIPPGVRYLGAQPPDAVAGLYDTHDLFVMPSRFEAFGIVFAEAVARGLPCVARDAYAMPEVVQPGVTGALVTGDDPAELARVIADTLADDALYANCRDRAEDNAAWFTWDRAGRQAVEAMTRMLG